MPPPVELPVGALEHLLVGEDAAEGPRRAWVPCAQRPAVGTRPRRSKPGRPACARWGYLKPPSRCRDGSTAVLGTAATRAL